MKTIVGSLFFMVFLQISVCAFSSDKDAIDSTLMPKKAIILTQSMNQNCVVYTILDDENNEMVILFYVTYNWGNLKLQNIIRTGIIIDQEKQTKIMQNDFPFIQVENK